MSVCWYVSKKYSRSLGELVPSLVPARRLTVACRAGCNWAGAQLPLAALFTNSR